MDAIKETMVDVNPTTDRNKRDDNVQKRDESSKKLKIDKKKLIIYSELLKPKFEQ